MKQIFRKAFLLLFGGLFMSSAAWADVVVPTPVYKLTFDDASVVSDFGGVQHGSGSIVTSSDVRFGKYYQNWPDVESGSAATATVNYLEVVPTTNPWESLRTSGTEAFTISFWCNAAVAKDKNIDSYWGSLFTGYANGGASSTRVWFYQVGPDLRFAGQYHHNNGGYSDDNADGYRDDIVTWREDKAWHHFAWVFSNVGTAASFNLSLYLDGIKKYEKTMTVNGDGAQAAFMLADLDRFVIGGASPIFAGDPDNAFAYDDIALYSQSLTAQQIRQIVFAKMPEKYFEENKGDLTEFINGTFETNANGWTGGTTWWSPADWRTRSWRGTELNGFYELGSTGTMTYTLPNMPAGTYKVVAAARGYDGGSITAQIAGTSGTALTCVGDQRGADDAIPEINTNGVEMPYSSLGGFTTDGWGHNWRWITATGILNETGNLVININGVGTSWMAIDDVHLYHMDECTSLGVLSSNPGNVDNGSKTITCDLILSNPNVVICTTGGKAIATASGDMNNNIYNAGGKKMSKMVLYDGYAYADYSTSETFVVSDATLYRTIPADQWCTLMVPFYPTNLDVMKVPSATDETTVTFVDAPAKDMNNEPMIVKSTAGVTKITGVRNGTYGDGYGDGTSGSGATMVGTYTNIAAVAYDNYILAHPASIDRDVLLKVNSAVGLKPFRAYFTIPTSANMLDIDFDSETTGVANVKDNMADSRSEYYDLQGRKITNPAKGLYIVNGKKVIIK